MEPFRYATSEVPVRDDIRRAHRTAWARLASPGSWWTGAERVAIAAEVRRARGCALCRERKAALSPAAVSGEHDCGGGLPAPAVEVVHRVVTDPGRISRAWCEAALDRGLGDAEYVELIGVLVVVVSIDDFHRGLGVPLEPLPEPKPGEPTRYRPGQARAGGGYVPMIEASGGTGAEGDLWERGRTANVIRALSLVPDAVRDLKLLSAAHYLPVEQVMRLGGDPGRALDRMQMELLAGRVSALNECFY